VGERGVSRRADNDDVLLSMACEAMQCCGEARLRSYGTASAMSEEQENTVEGEGGRRCSPPLPLPFSSFFLTTYYATSPSWLYAMAIASAHFFNCCTLGPHASKSDRTTAPSAGIPSTPPAATPFFAFSAAAACCRSA
jgi:hypothetical protein